MTDDRDRLLELDREARELAQTEFVTPLIVEAGAGTGKTALLTARVVSWCIGPGWERHAGDGEDRSAVARVVIERVVAITFTEAAAAEMATRVGDALSALARGESAVGIERELLDVADDLELVARCTALADEIHRLPALTIHAWCQRQLRGFPLEAGLHPGFQVDADGALVEEAAVEVVEEALRGLSDDPLAAEWLRLAEAGVVPTRIAEALRSLAQSSVAPEELERDPCADAAMAPLLDRLRTGIAAFREAEQGLLAAQSQAKRSATASQALARLHAVLEARTDVGGVVSAIADTEPRVVERIREWSRGKFGKTEPAVLGSAIDEVVAALAPIAGTLRCLATLRREELDAARRVLADLLGRLAERLRRSGIVTFEDLLVATDRLLASSPSVRAELRGRIDQLMVDEFQDTDDTQCRIVSWLALDGPSGERPGLFIVGDPKQSIYGWRRADLAAYHAFTARVAADGDGIIRPLVCNFRSVRPILDEVERVVAPVMEERRGVQPAFAPLEPTGDRRDDPGFSEQDRSAVEHWLAWPVDQETGEVNRKPTATETVLVEAANLAADIRSLHDQTSVAWGDVAVLLRTTTQQEVVLDSFRDAGIPFEVAREREYYRQREVVEAAALVRTVLEPADSLALLTVLRSDAVGVPDAVLVPLWESGLPGLLADLDGSDPAALRAVDACLARAAAAASADLPGADTLPRWPAAVRAAAETIALLRRAVHEHPPDRFVEMLRSLWLTEVTASARYLGRFRRARLERFLGELETALASADGSLAPVARFLRRAVEQGRDSQVPVTPDVSADMVHIMTIHGAKGLDFGHVYVVQTHRGTGGGGGAEVEIRRGPDAFEYSLFGWPTPGFEEAEAFRDAQAKAEQVRLLYVAMTRAKRRLVLSGCWAGDGVLVPAGVASSLADLAAHRLDPEATATQVQDLQRTRRELDRPVQWVLLGVDSPDPGALGDAGSTVAFDIERVMAEAERLAVLRGEAAARLSLPATAAVTALVHAPDAEWGVGQPDPETADLQREEALAVGTVIHRLLERIDLGGDLEVQLEASRDWVHHELFGVGSPTEQSAAWRLAENLLATMRRGACLARLGEIADGVVARELPLLLPPEPDDPVVGALVGTADLVYRTDEELVVADYKTDAITGDEQLGARVERYRPQLERYAGAIQSALGLAQRPLMELWFLAVDRIVRL